VLILRPSIVFSAGMPDQQLARQILWFVPVTRLFQALPIDPAARLDLVDVGFVADATLRLLTLPNRTSDCYHLSAGPSSAVTAAVLSREVDRIYRRRLPLQLIRPSDWGPAEGRQFVRTELQRLVYNSLHFCLPFINMDVVYSDTRLRRDVGPLPAIRPVTDYLADLLRLIRTKSALQEAALP